MYIHTLCMQSGKKLASLSIGTALPAGRCDKYQNHKQWPIYSCYILSGYESNIVHSQKIITIHSYITGCELHLWYGSYNLVHLNL